MYIHKLGPKIRESSNGDRAWKMTVAERPGEAADDDGNGKSYIYIYICEYII